MGSRAVYAVEDVTKEVMSHATLRHNMVAEQENLGATGLEIDWMTIAIALFAFGLGYASIIGEAELWIVSAYLIIGVGLVLVAFRDLIPEISES